MTHAASLGHAEAGSGLARLDEGGARLELGIGESVTSEALLPLPSGPGVLVLESRSGQTVLVATTANVRELARRRLAEHQAAERSPAADLRGVCAGGRAIGVGTGSALETDAVYLRMARERLPHAARVVSERWRAWFVHVDPDAPFPEWSKTNLIGLAKARSAGERVEGVLGKGVLLGPIWNKDAAGRFIEHAIDAFDLCRFHALLVLAPGATACAYKEMGRCPAPCDGSEPMAAYRERTRRAASVLAGGIEAMATELEAALASASAAQEFERAAEAKRALDRITPLRARAFQDVARLSAWQRILVLRGEHAGTVRLGVMDRGNLWRVGDAVAKDDDAVRAMCRRAVGIAAELERAPMEAGDRGELDPERIDSIGLFSRWLQMPAKKRGGVAIALGASVEAEAVKAARQVAKVGDDAGGVESQELEGLG